MGFFSLKKKKKGKKKRYLQLLLPLFTASSKGNILRFAPRGWEKEASTRRSSKHIISQNAQGNQHFQPQGEEKKNLDLKKNNNNDANNEGGKIPSYPWHCLDC